MEAVALVSYLKPSSRSETGQLCRQARIENEDTSFAFTSRAMALKHTPKTNEVDKRGVALKSQREASALPRWSNRVSPLWVDVFAALRESAANVQSRV